MDPLDLSLRDDWFGIMNHPDTLTLSQTSPCFYMSPVQVFGNTEEKGEIAQNQQLLHFPQCFLPFQSTFQHFHQI